MVNFLLVCSQVLCLIGVLYGAYLSIAHRGVFKPNQGRKYRGFELKPESAELLRLPKDLGYYV